MIKIDVDSLLEYDQETGIFKWKVSRQCVPAGTVAGAMNGKGYWMITVNGKKVAAHRLAFLLVEGVWPDQEIDHKDGNRANNALANLRKVDHATNMQNKSAAHSNSSTGLLGVSPKNGKFRATINVDGRQKYLGLYDTAEAAHAAYKDAKSKLHSVGVPA